MVELIYGGHFLPPHKGHLKTIVESFVFAVKDFCFQKQVKLVIVPSPNSKNVVIDNHKRKLLLVAFKEAIKNQILQEGYFGVEIELDLDHMQNGGCFRDYLDRRPKVERYIILGGDQIENFDKWERKDEYKEEKIILFPRDGELNIKDNECYFKIVHQIKTDLIPISSTMLRKKPARYKPYFASEMTEYIWNNVFNRIDHTVDVVVITNTNKVLVIKRGKQPFKGKYALPGGFIDMLDPTTAFAASRELSEETGIFLPPETLRYKARYGRIGRDPRGRTFSDVFLITPIPEEAIRKKMKAADDAASVELIPLDSNKLKDMAFNHREILDDLAANPQGFTFKEGY